MWNLLPPRAGGRPVLGPAELAAWACARCLDPAPGTPGEASADQSWADRALNVLGLLLLPRRLGGATTPPYTPLRCPSFAARLALGSQCSVHQELSLNFTELFILFPQVRGVGGRGAPTCQPHPEALGSERQEAGV